MKKNILYSFIVTLLCVFTLSCSFITESTGTVSFELPSVNNPELGRSISQGSDETIFNVIVKKSDGQILYNKDYPEKSSVSINNLPVGKVILTIKGENSSYSYSGSSEVIIKGGQTANARVELIKSKKSGVEVDPDVKPEEKLVAEIKGTLTGQAVPSNVELRVNISDKNNLDNNEAGIILRNGEKTFSFKDLKPSVYDIYVNGGTYQEAYVGKFENIQVKANEIRNIEVPMRKLDVGTIKGTVKLPVGVSGITYKVYVYSNTSMDNCVKNGTVNSDGTYTIEGVPIGNFTIKVIGENETARYEGECNYGDITLGINKIPEISLTKTEKSVISLKFTQGPSPAIDVNVNILKDGNNVKSITVSTSGSHKIKDLTPGTGYKVEIYGTNSTNIYKFTKDNITLNAGNNDLDVNLTGTPIEKPTPDPAKGIYVVDGISGDDSSNGAKAFKTIAKASKIQGVKTIYVLTDTKETETIKVPRGVTIRTPDNVIATVTSSATTCFDLDTSVQATFIGLNIVGTNSNTDSFVINIHDSANLTLGKDVRIKTDSTGKNVISLGSQATLALSSVENIDASNYIKVLNGAKISVNKNFSREGQGVITLNFEGNSDTSRAFISAEDPTELAESVNKFNIIGKNYTITSDGKLNTEGGSENITAVQVWDFQTLYSGINDKKSEKFEIKGNLTFNKTINIDGPITIFASQSVKFTRADGFSGALFKVNESGSLVIEGANSNTGKLSIDGNNIATSGPLISCYGELGLINCILENNNNQNYEMPRVAENVTGALYIGEGIGTAITNQVVSITDTDFKNNNVKLAKDINKGGAITIEPNEGTETCEVTITRGNIDGNSANHGAIDVLGIGTDKAKVKLNISNTFIKNNQSNSNGGGVNASNSTIILTGIEMTNNTAKSNGGGIAMNTADITISNSNIHDNACNATLGNNTIIPGQNTGSKGANLYVTNPGKLIIDTKEVKVNRNDWISEPITSSRTPNKNTEPPSKNI